jgi:hypothetical protein
MLGYGAKGSTRITTSPQTNPMMHEFEIELDVSVFEPEEFDNLSEKLWELGEEGALLHGNGSRSFLSVHLERSSLSEALIYTLSYLQNKSVPIKSLTAPKAE